MFDFSIETKKNRVGNTGELGGTILFLIVLTTRKNSSISSWVCVSLEASDGRILCSKS